MNRTDSLAAVTLARSAGRATGWAAGLALLAVAAALAGGCQNSAQPADAVERMKLEQERRVIEDKYAETLAQIVRFEDQHLDARQKANAQEIATQEAALAKADETLAGLESQRKALLNQMELTSGRAASQPGKDWAERVEAVKLMTKQAEMDRVTAQAKLAKAQEEKANLRLLLTQQANLKRDSKAQEDRLVELNHKLQ